MQVNRIAPYLDDDTERQVMGAEQPGPTGAFVTDDYVSFDVLQFDSDGKLVKADPSGVEEIRRALGRGERAPARALIFVAFVAGMLTAVALGAW